MYLYVKIKVINLIYKQSSLCQNKYEEMITFFCVQRKLACVTGS